MTQPLEGIRVLEVDNWGFAPSAGAVLADWGADVVKVEPPGRGDPLRVDLRHAQLRRERHGELHARAVEPQQAVDRARPHDRRRPRRARRVDRARATCSSPTTSPTCARSCASPPTTCAGSSPTSSTRSRPAKGSKGPDAGRPSYDYVSAWARAGVGERLTPEGAPFIQQRAGIVDTPAGNFLAGAIAAALLRTASQRRAGRREVSLLAAGGWIIGPDITFALNNGCGDAARPARRTRRGPAVHLVRVRRRAPARVHDDATRALLARSRAGARARRRS